MPYRHRPLGWSVESEPNKTYVNERAIGTQQTGWNYVAQIRPSMPTPLQSLLWFGVDDSATTVRFPIYGAARKLPASFAGKGPQDGVVQPMMNFDLKKAFYVFNLASNWAYQRWSDVYPVMHKKIIEIESELISKAKTMDANAMLAFSESQEKGLEMISEFGVKVGDELTERWMGFFGEPFVRFRDGYDITQNLEDSACGCDVGGNGYSKNTYERIVAETGDHYENVGGGGGEHLTDVKVEHKGKNKLSLRALN